MLSLFHSWVTEAIHDILPSSDIQTALFSHGSNLLRLTLKASALTIGDLEKLLTRIRYVSTQKAKEAPIIAATAPFQEEEKTGYSFHKLPPVSEYPPSLQGITHMVSYSSSCQ